MTELDRTWAKIQVESMADGTLSEAAEERMRAAMARDPSLADEVAAARALRKELRQLQSVRVPRGLWWRLWRIPAADQRPRAMFWMPAGVLATAVVVLLGANLYFGSQEPDIDEAARAAAVQDFAIAMAYLQKSAVMARNEVNETVGSSVLNALAVSRDIMDQSETGISEGEQNDED